MAMSREMLDAYREQVVDQQNVVEAYKVQLVQLQQAVLVSARWRNIWFAAFVTTVIFHLFFS